MLIYEPYNGVIKLQSHVQIFNLPWVLGGLPDLDMIKKITLTFVRFTLKNWQPGIRQYTNIGILFNNLIYS